MHRHRREVLRLAASAAALAALPRTARAENYPARPVRLIVGYPAGGSTDLVARIIGAWLSDRLGQSFVVENRPGAGTNIAVQAAVASPADGYTLLFVTTTNAINASFHAALPFDFLRDLAPVAALAELPFVMEVTPSLPVKTVAEFIAHAKANPGKINMASFGPGTISHLAGAPMVTDLIGGRVQAAIDALPNSLPHIRSGAGRALAMTGPTRSAAVPNVPTVGETLKSYEVSGWTGIAVPAGTPRAIIATLNREINAGLSDARIAARLAEVGGRPILVTADEFGAMWQRDTEKWTRVVKFAAGK